jgi:hypothetical protein
LFIFKPEFLKISADLQSALAEEMHLAEWRNNSVQFFIYLRAELYRKWPIAVSTNKNNNNKKTQDKESDTTKEKQGKMDQLRILH